MMFAFHTIGRQDETFLKADDERLKDFRSRLQYLARGVQGYIRKLKEFLAKPAPGTNKVLTNQKPAFQSRDSLLTNHRRTSR